MILVLIDFDGVIVDTKKNSFDIFKRCLENFQNCKNLKLIKNLYNKTNGLNLLSISKLLGHHYKTDYLKFYKYLISEWDKVYKEIFVKKEILEFFDFINNLDAKIAIFSSSNFEVINKILKTKLKKFYFVKKEFDTKFLLSKKTINKLKKLKKTSEKFINIDDNALINKQMTKLDFIPIHYEINKNKKNLTEIFIKVLFHNKINFFYNIYNLKFFNLRKKNFKVSKDTRNLSIKNFKKYIKKGYFNDKLSYLYNISFKNKKLNINSFNYYYNLRILRKHISLRLLRKHISLGIQAYIVIDLYNYIIGKRKSVISEKNKLEFVPSGGLKGLINFSINDLYSQIKSECLEELNLKINYKNITLIGFYMDFSENLLDFVFKTNLKNSTILRNKLTESEEHSKLLIKEKNYLKKNINQFTNTSKKIITKIVNEKI
tara:strand:+ start:386 stop:1678 length:1293 start_codon:yes stop_codon:yes gene_type:complete